MGLKSGLTKPTFVLLSTMEELVTLIKNIVATEEVVVLDVTGDGVSSPLKVVIDSEIPVDLSIVTRVTRLIKNAAEMEQKFPDGFRLEVGSAGIDAPLQHPFQYRKNINRDMRIKLLENQVEKELKAKITGTKETGIIVDTKSQVGLFIPFEDIVQAKLIISFKG